MHLNLSPIVFEDSFTKKIVVTSQHSLHIVASAYSIAQNLGLLFTYLLILVFENDYHYSIKPTCSTFELSSAFTMFDVDWSMQSMIVNPWILQDLTMS